MKKGSKHSKETQKKMSESRLKAFMEKPDLMFSICRKGRSKMNGFEGMTHSEDTKNRISESRKGKVTGIKNHKYLVDRSLLKKREQRNDPAYQEWRKSVWSRDNYKCRIANEDCKGCLEAHHILSWKDHPTLRYETKNGITLCHFHHPRKRADEVRLSPFFQELVVNQILP